MTEPFLKWAGGKRRLLPELVARLPQDFESRMYCEPFLGGGALFFSLATRLRFAYLGDALAPLIVTYRQVRDNLDALIDRLTDLADQISHDDFYRIRTKYNACGWVGPSDLVQAAYFIYLNKVGYNGMYRVNRNGEYNIPYGRYHNPKVLDVLRLKQAHAALQRTVNLQRMDFEDLGALATSDSHRRVFFYVDPPYDATSKTANFTSYSGRFDAAEQVRLAKAIRRWSQHHKIMVSQADTPRVRELYDGFNIERVTVRRSIAAKASSRKDVRELVIRNYT